jgi:hypothetical protein
VSLRVGFFLPVFSSSFFALLPLLSAFLPAVLGAAMAPVGSRAASGEKNQLERRRGRGREKGLWRRKIAVVERRRRKKPENEKKTHLQIKKTPNLLQPTNQQPGT